MNWINSKRTKAFGILASYVIVANDNQCINVILVSLHGTHMSLSFNTEIKQPKFKTIVNLSAVWSSGHQVTVAEILTSNSVGIQLFFLGCNQDNIGSSNFITKKKICLVLPEKEISNHRN